jgi:predicted DNA-binding ArsR family transcriptional regulator
MQKRRRLLNDAIELVTLNTLEAAVNRSKLENDLTQRRHVMEV